MFNRGNFGTGQEVSPGLTPQAKLLLLKIPPQIIQEGYNSQEDQQRQKNPPLVLPSYLLSPTRGHGRPKGNDLVSPSGNHQIPDPRP